MRPGRFGFAAAGLAGDLLLQGNELLAGVIGQNERARLELRRVAKGAVKPQGQLAGQLDGFKPLAVANAVVDLVRRLVAALAQRVQDLAHLRVQPQALVHGAQQLGLGALAHCEANAVCHLLREAFGQQAQFEDATGGVVGVEAFGGGAQLGQQGRVGGQKTEVARAHRARWCPNVNWATA